MWNEQKLDELLCTPSEALIEDMKRIDGDIILLGAGGKMGPTMCVLAANAVKEAGIHKRILAVSRFSDEYAVTLLKEPGVEIITCDLQDKEALYALPDCQNVIYMAGRKFGTNGQEWATWGMNATLPAFVADKYKNSNIVVFSSGNIYPIVPLYSGGCTEGDPVGPGGEYAMSCLARERAFEYAANTFGTKVLMYRLNFAVDLRYGVLCDLAEKLVAGEPIPLTTPCFNFIWQGSANEIAIRSLLYCGSPAVKLNVTGPETISIQYAAERMAKRLGVTPIFERTEGTDAYLNNASKCVEWFGYPSVSAGTLMDWQAEWFLDGGRRLNKPTHFEERGGKY
jgi:nucleoside-diphosphate-sugar epimerase